MVKSVQRMRLSLERLHTLKGGCERDLGNQFNLSGKSDILQRWAGHHARYKVG